MCLFSLLIGHVLQAEWLGERVATVDVDRAISNVIKGKEDAAWGPNAVFRYAPPATIACVQAVRMLT